MADSGLKLLFDENFSHKQVAFVASESRLAEMQHIHKLGWAGQPDVEWIPRAVDRRFVLVTEDRKEKTRGFTARELKAMSARVLLIGDFFDHLNRWDKAKWLVARIEDLVTVGNGLTPGSVTLVKRFGASEVV